MNNPEIGHFNTEPTSEQPPLDRREIFQRLARISRELGWGLDESVIEDLWGADDNDLLGNLTSLAYEYGMDPDELFAAPGIEMEEGS